MQLKTFTYTQMYDFLTNKNVEAKNLYINKDYTARQLAAHFGIFYNANFQKACLRAFGEKGKGLGGKRVGSGKSVFNIERKRKAHNAISINVSDEVLQILKSHEGSYTQIIDRALRYYDKVASLQIKDVESPE